MLGYLAPLPLAQTLSPQQRNAMLFWLGVLLVIVVIGFAVLMLFRRRLTEEQAPSSQDVGFSLSDLRAMRDRGEITAEEYERTRAKVVANVKRMVDAPPPSPKERRDIGGSALGDAGNGE
jgi:hypothetical protein